MLRQVGALAVLMLRFWRRGALRPGRAGGESRRASGFVLRVVFLLLFANVGRTYGVACARIEDASQALVACEWLVVGLGVLSAVFGFVSSGVQVRGVQGPLFAPMLDALPLSEGARVVVTVFQNVVVHALAVAAVMGAARGLDPGEAALLGLLVSTTGVLVGAGVVRLLRTFVSGTTLTRWMVGLVATQILGFCALAAAPALASWQRTAGLVAAALPVASAIVDANRFPAAAGWLVGVCVAACLAVGLAERIGYDRGDAVPDRRLGKVAPTDLTLQRVETVLSRREPTRRTSWVAGVYAVLLSGGAVVAAHLSRDLARGEGGTVVVRGAVFLSAFMVFTSAATRAARMAERDVVARPLLAPLPIAPSEAVGGKVATLRRHALLQSTPMLLLLAMPGGLAFHLEIAWRVATALAALAFSASALVSVGFLTGGLGAQRRGAVGASTLLESILVFLPVVRLATAESPWSALVSLACVVLLAHEARRAALGCVRWLDDDDPFERETPVWRALLVLAGFAAVQSLATQLLAWSPLVPGASVAIAYGLSAAALLAMTAYERHGLASIPVRPARAWHLGAGVLAGLAAGVVAATYAKLLAHVDVEVPVPPPDGGRWLLAGAVLVAAPVAEEVFFRGWLQDAVAREYEARGRWFAVVVTAFAFAAGHPAISFAPVLLLGLVTGTLFRFSRGVAPGVLAHAVYNGVVVAATWLA